MSDHQPSSARAEGTELSEGMRQFQNEVDALAVTGGKANPERNLLRLGVATWVASVIVVVIAYIGSHGTTNELSQRDFMIVALGGVVLAVIGTGLVITFTLTRYFRYWLIRLIYQDRENTDRLLDALGER